jgi:hypothetical protein
MSDINIVLENRDDIRVAVEEKDINVEVPVGKDGRSLRPRGEWSAAAAYAYLDLVSYQGSSYVATKAVPAGTLPTDTSYWMLSAEKGEPGGAVWGAITGDLSDQTDLQTALDAKADVIISSASGSIASFSDGSASPVTALSVSIEPVQEGTGDPSPDNVRPISGHTSAVVTRTGKNLLDKVNDVLGGYINSSGVFKTSSAGEKCIALFLKAGTYTLNKLATTRTLIAFYASAPTNNAQGTILSSANLVPRTITLTSDGYLVAFIYNNSGETNTWSEVLDSIQLELGSTATAYEAPQIQQLTIDLDGTRYGGTIDVLTGQMTVTKAYKTMSTNPYAWSKSSNSAIKSGRAGYYSNSAQLSDCKNPGNDYNVNNVSMIFNCAKSGYSTMDVIPKEEFAIGVGIVQNTASIWVNIDATIAPTKQVFANWLVDNPIQLVYPLATPIIVQLTPSQLSTLLGQNNIWADTGDTSVEYRADTKRYIDGVASATAKVTRQMIANSATADGKAPKSLATGDLIIVGDELRKATANIGNGSAITASNSTIATLADVIKALQ